MESAIMDTGDCQPLYHAIKDYHEGMNMKLDQQILMLLVERQALNEAIVGEKNCMSTELIPLFCFVDRHKSDNAFDFFVTDTKETTNRRPTSYWNENSALEAEQETAILASSSPTAEGFELPTQPLTNMV
ncbi:hypothetical protein V6N12_073979 [Hibiscus sabdariffa]|uniref:Protein DA1-like domain-containing protein n=1 Tax=Hibiscus sabdariffa TaxID=183260 RepID=A0ABR1ZYC2_9ROSI